MKDKKSIINTITSTLQGSDFVYSGIMTNEEYLNLFSQVICQFDTDIAIAVMEKLSVTFKEANDEALSIKINYGY